MEIKNIYKEPVLNTCPANIEFDEIVKSIQEELKNHENIVFKNINNKKLSELPTKKRLEIINQYLNSNELNPTFEAIFKRFSNKKLVIVENKNWKKIKKIKFSNIVEKHKEQVKKNIITLALLIMHIESDGDPLAKNKNSSAKWLGQWLNWNWKEVFLYYHNWKYYPKKYFIKKHIPLPEKKNKFYALSSWETTLNKIIKNYKNPKQLIQLLPEKAISKIKDNFPNLKDPTKIDWKDQIKILLLSMPYTDIQSFLLWNIWNHYGALKLYEKHHTNPKADTKKRIANISPIYLKKLTKISLK